MANAHALEVKYPCSRSNIQCYAMYKESKNDHYGKTRKFNYYEQLSAQFFTNCNTKK